MNFFFTSSQNLPVNQSFLLILPCSYINYIGRTMFFFFCLFQEYSFRDNPKYWDKTALANTVGPEKTAPKGTTLFYTVCIKADFYAFSDHKS